MIHRYLCFGFATAAALASAPVQAAPHPRAHAIVIGSNPGGPGQSALRFAEDDAQRVALVLREVGRFEPRDIHVLLHPTPADVLSVIDAVGAETAASAARGDHAEVVFYYSGHAKATALHLGADDLPLATLRARLVTLKTTPTIVVLARQSDAFSRRLETFGYSSGLAGENPDARASLGVSRAILPYLAGVFEVSTLEAASATRTIGTSADTVAVHAYGGGLYLRASLDVVPRWLAVFAQAGGGMALGTLEVATAQSNVPSRTKDHQVGPLYGGSAGVSLRLAHAPLTFFLRVGYERALAVHDLIGDTHDSGGTSTSLGLRLRFGEGQ